VVDSSCQFGQPLVGVGLQQLGSALRPSKEFNWRDFVRNTQEVAILVFVVRFLTSQVLINSLVHIVSFFLLLLSGHFTLLSVSALRLNVPGLFILNPFINIFIFIVFILGQLLVNLGVDEFLSDFSHFASSVNNFLPVHHLLEDSCNPALHGEILLPNFVGYRRCKLIRKDSLHCSLALFITRVIDVLNIWNRHCFAVVVDSRQPTSLRQRPFVDKDTVSVV